MRYHQQTQSVTITQRGRGLYLCHWYEDRHAQEEYEACPTLAAAKRWCAQHFAKRPNWQELDRDGYWTMWLANENFDGDEIYEDD